MHVSQEEPISKSNLTKPSNSYVPYGPGAESKMRLEETSVKNTNTTNANLRAMPVSEGRMRAQEQSRYSVSLQANISYGQQQPSKKYESPHEAFEAVEMPRSVSNKSVTKPPITKSIATPKARNPFEEENSYDESKNPFADEPDASDDSNEQKPNQADGNNPFEEYDNNLNPFS